jgi:WD40 repeat protein
MTGRVTLTSVADARAFAGSLASSDVAVGLGDGEVLLGTRNSLAPVARHGSPVNALGFDAGGRYLVSGGDREVLITDVATRTSRGRLAMPPDRGPVRAVAVNGAGTRVAIATDGGWVVTWRIGETKPERQLKVSTSDVFTIAFSPDGARMAFGGDARIIWIWDLQGADPCGTDAARAHAGALCLRGHTDRVRSVAWDPAGRELASGGEDATALIWDLAAPEASLYTLPVGTQVNALSFGPRGSSQVTVASASLATWSLDLSVWRREACHIVRGTRAAASEPRIPEICRA